MHLPHAKSTSFETWLESDRQYIDTLFDEFMSELASQNEGVVTARLCRKKYFAIPTELVVPQATTILTCVKRP